MRKPYIDETPISTVAGLAKALDTQLGERVNLLRTYTLS